MASVAYMDVAIGMLATITLILALPFVLHAAGGWGTVTHALPATHFQVLGDFSLAQAFELALPTMLLMLGNQSMYQKFFSAKSEKDARNAVVGWIFGTVILETVIVALAVFGSVLFPSGEVHQRPREIIAYTALHGLPAWLGALLMGAVFAKIISTANNYLFSPATNLINDVFSRYIAPDASNKRVIIVSRLVVVVLGIWALYQAVNTSSVLAKTLYAYTIYSAALTPVILAAFYSRRANAQGAVSAIAAGTLVTFFWDVGVVKQHLPSLLAQRDAIFPALIAALVCLVVVSALTPPPKAEQVALFFPAE
jgi:SSS family solute:Na+ symporter/sodium/proline symporter